MKKTIAFLLCLVLTSMLFLCACTSSQEDVLGSTEAVTTSFESPTTEVTETQTEILTTEQVTETTKPDLGPLPTEEDFENLQFLIPDGFWLEDYNSKKSALMDYFVSGIGLFTDNLYFISQFYPSAFGDGSYTDSSHDHDPLGAFKSDFGFYPYEGIKAETLECIMENCFNNYNYPNHNNDLKDGTGSYYYKDGWYYFRSHNCGHVCGESVYVTHAQKINGHTKVQFDFMDCSLNESNNEKERIESIVLDTKFEVKENQRLWTIYSSKITYQAKGAKEHLSSENAS